jgi:hypothetical protein
LHIAANLCVSDGHHQAWCAADAPGTRNPIVRQIDESAEQGVVVRSLVVYQANSQQERGRRKFGSMDEYVSYRRLLGRPRSNRDQVTGRDQRVGMTREHIRVSGDLDTRVERAEGAHS